MLSDKWAGGSNWGRKLLSLLSNRMTGMADTKASELKAAVWNMRKIALGFAVKGDSLAGNEVECARDTLEKRLSDFDYIHYELYNWGSRFMGDVIKKRYFISIHYGKKGN